MGAIAASSCCVLPLSLFALGASGAWVAGLTQLAPYQPYFIVVALGFVGWGWWLVYRASRAGCAEGQSCTRPFPSWWARAGLIFATALIIGAVGFDLVAPLFLLPS